jgi:hypothetical protein
MPIEMAATIPIWFGEDAARRDGAEWSAEFTVIGRLRVKSNAVHLSRHDAIAIEVRRQLCTMEGVIASPAWRSNNHGGKRVLHVDHRCPHDPSLARGLEFPDLAVEVLSETNVEQEMQAKLVCYFQAGVCAVWYVDPATRGATMYTSPDDAVVVEPTGELAGGDVLPGFRLSLRWLFELADRQGPRPTS